MTAEAPAAYYEYQAKQTDNGPSIHSYALELISYICNNTYNNNSLDSPLSCSSKESEQERLIRLELRHRLHCAKAIQMPVVVFAKKLVEDVWGGQLTIEATESSNTTSEGPQEQQPPITSQVSESAPSSSSSSSSEASVGGGDDFLHHHDPIMDAATDALQIMECDDHFLFSTDDLEEDLNSAAVHNHSHHGLPDIPIEQPVLASEPEVDHETIASVPSLQTAAPTVISSSTGGSSTLASGRSKRTRKPRSVLLEEEPDDPPKSSSKSSQSKPKPVKKKAAAAPKPSTAATTSSPKPAAPKKRKAPASKRKVEPLAKQAIPGSGRGSRQKMFSWDDRMVQLADYKEKFGHIAIPTVRRDPYYNLGLWLAAQRSLYRKNTLRKERLEDLRKLGCIGFGGPGG